MDEWSTFKGITIPEQVTENNTFQRLCSLKPTFQIQPPCYPTSQLKEMKPVEINTLDSRRGIIDVETERQNA